MAAAHHLALTTWVSIMAPYQIQQGDLLLYENGIDTGFCITAEIYAVVLVEGDRVAFIATNITEEQCMAALPMEPDDDPSKWDDDYEPDDFPAECYELDHDQIFPKDKIYDQDYLDCFCVVSIDEARLHLMSDPLQEYDPQRNMSNLKYANIFSPLTDSHPRSRLEFLFDAFVGPAMDFKPLIKLTDVNDTSDNAAGIDFGAYPFKRANEPSWSDLPERPGQHLFPAPQSQLEPANSSYPLSSLVITDPPGDAAIAPLTFIPPPPYNTVSELLPKTAKTDNLTIVDPLSPTTDLEFAPPPTPSSESRPNIPPDQLPPFEPAPSRISPLALPPNNLSPDLKPAPSPANTSPELCPGGLGATYSSEMTRTIVTSMKEDDILKKYILVASSTTFEGPAPDLQPWKPIAPSPTLADFKKIPPPAPPPESEPDPPPPDPLPDLKPPPSLDPWLKPGTDPQPRNSWLSQPPTRHPISSPPHRPQTPLQSCAQGASAPPTPVK